MKHPTLYHRGKTGGIHSWTVWTEGNKIFTEHGLLKGKKQISTVIAEPKNIGKKNATTAEQQAELEAKSLWTNKLERKYSLTPEKAKEPVLLPMLALDFQKRKDKDVVYPGYVQRKYDGVRCLARWEDKKVVLLSRNGKTYNCPHITKELENIMGQDDVFDGELYVHGVGFQTVTSWVKKLQKDTSKIEYHVYDVPEVSGRDDLIFKERNNILKGFGSYPHIKFVPTYEVMNEREVKRYQSEFIKEGFEGAIFRNANGLYLYGHRSNDLLKVKTFDEDEFQVTGYTEGKGKDAETVIWVCKARNGEIFSVRSADTYDNRKEQFQNAHNYIGQQLSVKYFGFTDEGLPRFPTGIGFKEDR